MLADEQGLAAGFWMRAHDGLRDRLDGVDLRGREIGPPRIALLQFGVLAQVPVLRTPALDGILQRGRQGVPGAVLVREERVAAFVRQLLRVQHRAQAGRGHVREVGVPVGPGVAQADRLAVLEDVGDHQDLRLAGELELVEHVDLQRPEASAERDL